MPGHPHLTTFLLSSKIEKLIFSQNIGGGVFFPALRAVLNNPIHELNYRYTGE